MSESQVNIRDDIQEKAPSRIPFPDPFHGIFSLDHFKLVQGAHNFLGGIVNGVVGLVTFGNQGGVRTQFEDNIRLGRYKESQNDVI